MQNDNPIQTLNNGVMNAIVNKAITALKDKNTQSKRIDMSIPVDYIQFKALLSASAERIMSERGEDTPYIIDAATEAVIAQIYNFTKAKTNKGIALVGKFGCGKSLLMQAYVQAHNTLVSVSRGRILRGVYERITASRLFMEAQDINVFNKLRKVPLLIDELGREPIVGKSFGTDVSPVINLLCERWDYGAITHITANKKLETLSNDKHYGAMVGDRLRDMFVFIEMGGESKRNKHK